MTKTEYSNDVEFVNHFIFSLECKLSKVSFIIVRSSESNEYTLLILILFAQFDFKSMSM
jgi:hypothetical protein